MSSLMGYQAKRNEKYMPVLRCILSLKGTSLCLVVLHQQISFFTPFFIFIWYCLKKDFCHKFFFLNGFAQTTHLPYSQKLLNVTKNFCQYFLTFCKTSLPDFASAQISHQKKNDWIDQFLLILEAKFCLQSFKPNNFKLTNLIKF